MNDYEKFDIIWNEMSLEEKNVIVSSYLKTLPKWDLKRILCDVLQCGYMEDEALRKEFEAIIYTR
jgi:hypothetical protein